ncbi:MAG: ArsR/SmtB family transcription factor [Chloroflexota bacterium]
MEHNAAMQDVREALRDLEARLERVEQLAGLDGSGNRGNRGSPEAQTETAGTGDFTERPRPSLRDWLHSQLSQPWWEAGQCVSAIGIITPDTDEHGTIVGQNLTESTVAWGPKRAAPPWDTSQLSGVASICQALASEARLSLLRELVKGPKTTGELVAAAGVDRGQLYHHLRDLFVEGLASQPERGRYEVTRHGRLVLLVAGHLPKLADRTVPVLGIDLGDVAGESSKTPEMAETTDLAHAADQQ